MSERDEYWQDRLTEQEIACERRVEALEARLAMARDALDELMSAACECVGPDEDNQPECVCCHTQLDAHLGHHRPGCLANAILSQAHVLTALNAK